MTKPLEIYKCEICGNIVEMLHDGAGQLICCGQPMKLLVEKTEDVGNEKHVPIIEIFEDHIRVKVGDVPHPMEEKHHIEWIELIANGTVKRVTLSPGDKPVADFCTCDLEKIETFSAREHCNIHGLWKSK